MGVQLCGISCNSLEDHVGWTKDVLSWAGDTHSSRYKFPIIEDYNRELVTTLGMLYPFKKDESNLPLPAKSFIYNWELMQS